MNARLAINSNWQAPSRRASETTTTTTKDECVATPELHLSGETAEESHAKAHRNKIFADIIVGSWPSRARSAASTRHGQVGAASEEPDEENHKMPVQWFKYDGQRTQLHQQPASMKITSLVHKL